MCLKNYFSISLEMKRPYSGLPSRLHRGANTCMIVFFLAVHAIFRIIRLMSFFSTVDLLFIRWLANLFL